MGKILFIIGASRCGTTMLSSIMGNNENIFSFKELHYFDEMVGSKSFEEKYPPAKAAIILAQLITAQEKEYWHRNNYDEYLDSAIELIGDKPLTLIGIYELFLETYLNKTQKTIACKQTPRYIQHLDNLYPNRKNSYFIQMVRDPRDSTLSQKKRWKRRFLGGKPTYYQTFRAWIQYNPIITARVFRSNVGAGLKYEGKDRYMVVKYEDFVDQPEDSLREICIKTGIDYSDKMLDIKHISSSFVTSHQVKGISKDRKFVWKNGGLSEAELSIIQKINKDLIHHFNYEYADITPNPLKVFYYYLILPVQLFFIVLINLNKTGVIKFFMRNR